MKDNGFAHPKVEYPAVFGNGLQGLRAIEDIKPDEVLIAVPTKTLISVEHARKSELSELYESHDALFMANSERDFLILTIFVIFEKLKGDQSFYEPYLSVVNPGTYTCYWVDEYIDKCDDPEISA